MAPAAPSFGEEGRATACSCVFVLYLLAGNGNGNILNDHCSQTYLEENYAEGKRKLRIIQGVKGRPWNQLQRAATKWTRAVVAVSLEVARMESKRNHPRHAAVSNVTSSIIRSATSDFGING